MRVVFMGTPEFAVASLEALIEGGYEIVGVITAADKGVGRGQRIQESAVKSYALEHKLNVLQPTNLKDPEFHKELASLKADLQVVVAFRMLPETVWNMPKRGTINLHASLLPDYRGAAPINWTIINGDTETGLTTFFIEKQIDTGKVLMQEKVAIPGDWSAGQLHDEMMVKGGVLLINTLREIESGAHQAVDQSQLGIDLNKMRPAPKIFKDDCKINWLLDATSIYNHIRGLSPYPAAWCELVSPDGNSVSIKIFTCSIAGDNSDGEAGSIKTDGKKEITVHCNSGSLALGEVQLAGKRRMSVPDFLRGFDLNNKWTLK